MEVRAILAELARNGATVFLSSHVLSEVEQLCSRIAILRHGRVVADGPTAELLRDQGTILIRFDSTEESDAARRVLVDHGVVLGAGGADDERVPVVLARAGAADGSRLTRILGGAELYPAELTIRRASLEAAFLDLTRDDPPDQPAGEPDPPTDATSAGER